ncbi:MAG: hypothetical protein MJZ34_13920 [Paludibacteraceae bacterium]|nr:hypothetical protein [Paludibacteraceae bacterium]
MNVRELTRNQLVELKQNYLTEKLDQDGQSPSYGELATADETISDEEVFSYYAGTEFSEDDFSTCDNENHSIKETIVEKLIDTLTPVFQENYHLDKDEVRELIDSNMTEEWFKHIHELAIHWSNK